MDVTIVRWLALAACLLFTGYTVYCVKKEHFWRTCLAVWKFRWGRQVTIDLYLGLSMFVFFIYLHTGSVLTALIWLIPTYGLGNITPLFYLFWHFESIVGRFGV